MRNLFNKLNPKSFKISCISLCLFGDLSFCGYMYSLFSDKEAYLQNYDILKGPLNEAFKQQGMMLPKNIEHEIFHLMIQTLIFMLVLFLLAHTIIYTFYFFQKRFAFLYIKFISFMGTLGALLFAAATITVNTYWGIIFLLVTLAYLFVIFGTYYFPIHPKKN